MVRNRHTWTVTALHDCGGLTVAHPDRGTVTLSADYVGRHVELGWAVTGYGNQGDTVDVGLAVLEPGTTRNHAYVALTRGRHTNRAWIPDPTGTLDPADALAGMIERTPNGGSALALRRQLYRGAGRLEPDLPAFVARSRAPEGAATRVLERPSPDLVDEMQRRLDRLQAAPDGVGRIIRR